MWALKDPRDALAARSLARAQLFLFGGVCAGAACAFAFFGGRLIVLLKKVGEEGLGVIICSLSPRHQVKCNIKKRVVY